MMALITTLISPLGTALFLGPVAVILSARGWRRMSMSLAVFAVSWLWLWSMPIASASLRGQLERPFPLSDALDLPRAEAIVVLGGGLSSTDPSHPLPNLSDASDRVWHAARLYHAGKAPIVLLSGGSDTSSGQRPEAEDMQTFVRDLGVPAEAIHLELNSRNTRENAIYSAEFLRRHKIHRVLLVTSALHMERALSHFRAQGVTPFPVGADHTGSSPSGARAWLPDAHALDGSGQAFKELVGMLVLRAQLH